MKFFAHQKRGKKKKKKKMEANKMKLRRISILNDTNYYLLDAIGFIELDLFLLQSNSIHFSAFFLLLLTART